jgi:hypothetical protein
MLCEGQPWTLGQLHGLCLLRRGPCDIWTRFLVEKMQEAGEQAALSESDTQLAYVRWVLTA